MGQLVRRAVCRSTLLSGVGAGDISIYGYIYINVMGTRGLSSLTPVTLENPKYVFMQPIRGYMKTHRISP